MVSLAADKNLQALQQGDRVLEAWLLAGMAQCLRRVHGADLENPAGLVEGEFGKG